MNEEFPTAHHEDLRLRPGEAADGLDFGSFREDLKILGEIIVEGIRDVFRRQQEKRVDQSGQV